MVTKIRPVNGGIYAAGLFYGHVATLNFPEWSNYALLSIWGDIRDIAVSGDDIYAVAWDEGVYRWNGTSWNLILDAGNVLPDDFETILIDGSNLYIGGIFELAELGTVNIAQWKNTLSTSIGEVTGSSYPSLSVSPNPTEGIIHYSFIHQSPADHKVTLLDEHGRIVLQNQSNTQQLDITPLPVGMYFLQVDDHRKTGIAKIVKE